MADFLCVCGCGARVIVKQISEDGLVYGVIAGSKEHGRLVEKQGRKEFKRDGGMETRELGR